MPSAFDYDLIVIGAGPGGYVAALRAAQLKMSVAIIEEKHLGGVCLNVGCIPSKTLIHLAGIYKSASELENMGIAIDRGGFDYAKVQALSRNAADTLSKGVAYLLKKNGVNVFFGRGVIQSPHEVAIDGGRTLSGRNIIIATGSGPRKIAGFDFNESTVLSSTGALMMTELPKSLLIIGGGAIGVEFGYIMNCFGVKVYLVEIMENILPLEDEDITALLRKIFVKRGIVIATSTKAVSMSESKNGVDVVLEASDGTRETVSVEKILVVVGRTPNTDGIGLENIGIITDRGFISVKDFGETPASGVYAIGDVVATPLLAHVASREAEIAVEHIAGISTLPAIDPLLIPRAVYCEPQIGSFGLTENEARARGIEYVKAEFPFRGIGKAVADGTHEGFVKLITDARSRRILGAHIIGAQATELIHELLLAKNSGLTPADIAAVIHAHPTLSEIVLETARASKGRAIHI